MIFCVGGCVIPYAIPPLRGEVGGVTTFGEHNPAMHVAGGAHLASGTLSREQKFDLGAGGFADWGEDGRSQKGAYVDGAVFVDHGATTRTSVGVRGELRWADGRDTGVMSTTPGAGAKLRIDHEVFGTDTKDYSGSDTCSAIAGTYRGTAAVGVYAEAGRVWLPDNGSAWTATAGFTLRLPASMGIVVGVPGCK